MNQKTNTLLAYIIGSLIVTAFIAVAVAIAVYEISQGNFSMGEGTI